MKLLLIITLIFAALLCTDTVQAKLHRAWLEIGGVILPTSLQRSAVAIANWQ